MAPFSRYMSSRKSAFAVLLSTVGAACAPTDGAPAVSPAPSARLANARSAETQGDTASVVPSSAAQTLLGAWYLDAEGERLTMEVTAARGGFAATIAPEGGAAAPLAGVSWDAAQATLQFQRAVEGGVESFRVKVVEGVLAGRFTRAAVAAPALAGIARSLTGHVTGWSEAAFGRAIVPRVFDLHWADGRRGVVRLDRAAEGGGFVGTLKVYATDQTGAVAEGEQRDLGAIAWDGAALSFEVAEGAAVWRYAGRAAGRTIRGDAAGPDGAAPVAWTGVRAEVLSHGLTPRGAPESEAWRASTRARLQRLMMAGAPPPASSTVTVIASSLPPIASRMTSAARDDDTTAPQRYALSELRLTHEINDAEGAVATRSEHVYVARPTTAPPRGGYPLVVAFNGHFGSARGMMDPDNSYWYGDAYARRGYVVVAVDVSHRPPADRQGLYGQFDAGDEPAAGNGPHPAVTFGGADSDWEEDGERAWDGMRAIDYALSLPDVNRERVLVTGLSMGGEVATFASALDPRVTSAVIAGFSPDLHVIDRRANHACWRWAHADVTEYVDLSDLHALIAPRLLVVETGTVDRTFSDFRAPYAADKQVLRRSRAAYGTGSRRVVHYLHDGGHAYRVGDPSPESTLPHGISTPLVTAPDAAGSLAWQSDATTSLWRATVFDLTAGFPGR